MFKKRQNIDQKECEGIQETTFVCKPTQICMMNIKNPTAWHQNIIEGGRKVWNRIQIQENFPLSQVYVLGNINIAICLYEHQGN